MPERTWQSKLQVPVALSSCESEGKSLVGQIRLVNMKRLQTTLESGKAVNKSVRAEIILSGMELLQFGVSARLAFVSTMEAHLNTVDGGRIAGARVRSWHDDHGDWL